MMSPLEIILAVYVIGFILTFILSFLVYNDPPTIRAERIAARCLLLSPVWPAVALALFSVGFWSALKDIGNWFRDVWADADFKGRNE